MPRTKTNPLLLIDFYKATHYEQYNRSMTKLVSYMTPRMTRLPGQDKLVFVGLQGFTKEYLIDGFNDNFFSRPKSEVLKEYARVLDNALGVGIVDYDKIGRLHDLGYLPIEIKALSEGTRVPIKVPMFEISNTHPDFAWLVNTLETALSCSLWHMQLSANVGYMYRQIVNKYYDLTVDDNIPKARAIGDFSMRGQESIESAIKSSAGFALSFLNTATVPMITYFEEYYRVDIEEEPVAFGLTSTEHSVMCSNYAIDGDEVTMLRRLLTEIYPNTSFNCVSDSYDYWNFVNKMLPQCREEILEHGKRGCFLGVRGDSGDPVKIVTETVFALWREFGGTTNSKGYKVLSSCVKAVYGDSITPQRLEQIYQILMENGFACNNVSLASGSFSMQCLEAEDNWEALSALYDLEKGFLGADEAGYVDVIRRTLQRPQFLPYTRDTFGMAIKSTYCEVEGQPVMIFKDPISDTGNFKRSQRGLCVVYLDANGELTYQDGFDSETIKTSGLENLLVPVFRDGVMLVEQTLQDIRQILHDGKF